MNGSAGRGSWAASSRNNSELPTPEPCGYVRAGSDCLAWPVRWPSSLGSRAARAGGERNGKQVSMSVSSTVADGFFAHFGYGRNEALPAAKGRSTNRFGDSVRPVTLDTRWHERHCSSLSRRWNIPTGTAASTGATVQVRLSEHALPVGAVFAPREVQRPLELADCPWPSSRAADGVVSDTSNSSRTEHRSDPSARRSTVAEHR